MDQLASQVTKVSQVPGKRYACRLAPKHIVPTGWLAEHSRDLKVSIAQPAGADGSSGRQKVETPTRKNGTNTGQSICHRKVQFSGGDLLMFSSIIKMPSGIV